MADECDPQYTVTYYTNTGGSVGQPLNISNVQWDRRLDDISRAMITYSITGDDCCDILGDIEPWVHEMAIRRNGDLVWYGWVTRVEYGRDVVEVEARDALIWLARRAIHNDISFTDTDLSDIFVAIWDDAMSPDPVRATVEKTPSGVRENRAIKTSENRYAWNVVKEMLDSGLDVTVIGNIVLAGIVLNSRALEIRLADVIGDVRVTKDGMRYANRVLMDAGDQATGVWPPGDPNSNDYYPLLEIILKDFQVEDAQSAENRAKARYEYSRIVPRLIRNQDSITLNPNSMLEIRDLVAGVRVAVDTSGLCYNQREMFRLGKVDVAMSGGVETIQLGLQPSGPSGGLSEAEEPL